jgi:Cu(I)/Ag(I) efflux system periplasmic protein CusF
MTTLPFRPLTLAGFILLAVPACANSSASSAASASPDTGVDLGPSSRVPHTQLAVGGAGHEARRTMSDMTTAPVQRVHKGGSDAHATGTVNGVDPAKHTINLSHGAIPALGWPAMTMDFAVSPSVDLSRIKPGSRVNFSLEKNKSGMYEVQSVQPGGGGR